MKYLPTGGQMKQADQYTIGTLGVPSLTLMERAADACVKVIQEEVPDLSRVLVVCGSGNNGGDGLAIARMLAGEGISVQVLLAGNPDHFTEEVRHQGILLDEAGVTPVREWKDEAYSLIVDALFGVGLCRDIEGEYAQIIDKMNACDCAKLAVDIPSGISADTGAVMGSAFKADLTVTMQEIKRGLLLYPGQSYAGRIIPADIGIDTRPFDENLAVACMLEGGKNEEDANDYSGLLPLRRPDTNKGSYGKLLVISGSKGMSGAAFFNACAAYTAGAGLVRIYTAEANRQILQTLLPEAIITTYTSFDEGELMKLLKWADAVCVGSGLGTSDKAGRIVETVLENVEVPCLVDGDGLNLIAAHKRYYERMETGSFVFTPHMKEMSRLTGKTVAEIRNDRFGILDDFVNRHQLTCVLKDARTVIQTAGDRPYLNVTGNAAMAKAGSGDVLAGIIAGLLAQGLSCTDAALLGTYLHGRGGDLVREQKGSISVLARDLIEGLAQVLREEES